MVRIKGSIKRISIRNFLTYKEVEFYPNAGLNIITGPNGSGKSTLVCALMLGLSGKPSIIGRAKMLKEFVRTGSTEATLEIELYGESGEEDDSVVITHNFNVDNKSIWTIDNKVCNAKDVDRLVSSMNIKIDNLCQILPQDKLQDFVTMNPQEMLRSTQVAIGSNDLLDLLNSLCEEKRNQRKVTATLASNKKSLVEFEKMNNIIKDDIEILNQMKLMMKEFDVCKKKKMWLEYEKSREELIDIKNEENEILSNIQKEETLLKPYESDIQIIARNIASTENTMSKIHEKMADTETQIENLTKESDSQKDSIRRHIERFKMLKNDANNKQRNIEESELRLSKLQNDKQELENRYTNINTMNDDVRQLNLSLENDRTKESQLRSNHDNLLVDINNIKRIIQINKNKLNELSNVKNKRLQFLQDYHPDTYKAILWLRENTGLFHGNVYEPMLLELNFTETKYSRYLENTVPMRDLIAFTFESSEDMNLFLTNIRKQNLKLVNSVCSQPLNDNFTSTIPISRLRQHGFSAYLAEAVKAPEAIMRYLCKTYRIHNIPIGDKHTYLHSENVPPEITTFFSENHRFNISTSKYSGSKTSNMSEVRSARALSNTVDESFISDLTQRISQSEIEEKQKQKDLETCSLSIENIEKNISNRLKTKQSLTNTLNQYNTLISRIGLQIREITKIKSSVIDIDLEKEKMDTNIANCIKLKKDADFSILEFFKKLQNIVINFEIIDIKLGILRNAFTEKKNLLSSKQIQLKKLQENLEEVKVRLNSAMANAKSKLNVAKSASDNCMITDSKFPFKEQFKSLPDELGALIEHIAELQTKIDCSHDIDSNIVNEFENREKQIVILKKDIDEGEQTIKSMDTRMESLKNEWLPPLNSKIQLISQSFAQMFSQMGCAGEVKLSKSGQDDDYDKYGISLMVKFREQQNLQPLSPSEQSGGERAIATAVYLMALQQLSKVPFRCVDEINQGMDPINERIMMDILFKTTSNRDNQYFFLTPKLLSNIEYSRSTKIHIIQNGSMIPKFYEWDLKKFIAPKENTKKPRVKSK